MKLLIFFSLTLSLFSGEVKFINNLEAGKAQKIVVYGTSLTAKGPWVSMLAAELRKKYGEKAAVINSGGSGMDSNWGLANVNKKVVDHQPDAVFIEFGMNDAVVRFKNSKEKVRGNLETIIKQVQNELPDCEIILMTMNPAMGIPAGHRSARDDLNGYYDIYRDLAKKYKFKLIDHFKTWQTFLKKNEDYKKYIPDGIHPNKSGCEKVILPTLIKELGLK